MGRIAAEKPTDSDPDVTGWYRKDEAQRRIGTSLAGITRLTEKGRLHPHVVDGVNWYDPAEVDELALERGHERKKLTTPDGRRELYAEFQVNVVRDIVGLVKDPREKIDAIQFQIIAELRARVALLETELDKQRAAVESAKDQTLERNMAIEMSRSETRIKEIAAARMVETIGKLIGGKEGVALTPAQLEQLVLANSDGEERFLTPEQEKRAKEIVAQANAKKNSKGTAETVASAVKQAAGVSQS